ncbi:MAG: hypothetical protein EBU33_09495, partial [Sphingobacteriia bacterium]|nr:hypothetical protein [Sphingobacteriia bacterium]
MSELIAGYHFRVDFCVNNKYIKDIAFKNVGILKVDLDLQEKKVGASSVNSEYIIQGAKYGDLVLERGVTTDSSLYTWLTTQVETKKIKK